MADFVPEDLAYAAGIIDGEGYIGITETKPNYVSGDRKRRQKSPSFICRVTVAMCDPNVPVWLTETFGGTVHSYPPRKEGTRGSHHWVVQGPTAAAFCELIHGYLKVKRQQAELLMSYYADPRFVFKQRQGIPDTEIEQRREYVTTVKALNRGGK